MKRYRVLVFVFLIFVIAGIIFFIYGYCNIKNQSIIVQKIRAKGGIVLYDYQYDFSSKNNRIKDYYCPPAPSVLITFLFGNDFCSSVVYVQLSTQTYKSDFLHDINLKQLKQLQHLHLSGKGINNEIIPYLMQLSKLRSLDLFDTSLSSDDITILRLNLTNCNICVEPYCHKNLNKKL
ncbi:MAG: hypothetical protein LBP59_03360 [Planctomycetaceae bacterium]|jgi:hypothetical protein|nr:hypothetical protein [Planctomycetaceae bacterium]